jgi:hypothetical protein
MPPSLVVWGARDRILPVSTGKSLASQIPDARLVLLEAVGHCPMFEASGQFSALLTDFARDPINGRPPSQEQLPYVMRRRGRWWTSRRKLRTTSVGSVPRRSVL